VRSPHRWLVYACAVLRDDVVEQVEPKTNREQIVEPPPGDQNGAAARGTQAPDRRRLDVREMSIDCDRAVVIGRASVVAHERRLSDSAVPI
jgi:hypothetical protein